MIVLSPQEIESIKTGKHKFTTEREQEWLNRIIDEFHYAVIYDIYHQLSSPEEKIVFYPAQEDYCKPDLFKKAQQMLIEKGWNVRYERKTCAMGWYNALVITTKSNQ